MGTWLWLEALSLPGQLLWSLLSLQSARLPRLSPLLLLLHKFRNSSGIGKVCYCFGIFNMIARGLDIPHLLCLSVCLSVCLCLSVSFHLSLSLCLSSVLSVPLSVSASSLSHCPCLPFCLSDCLCLSPPASLHLSFNTILTLYNIYVCVPACLSFCLSTCFLFYLSIHPVFTSFVEASLFVCPISLLCSFSRPMSSTKALISSSTRTWRCSRDWEEKTRKVEAGLISHRAPLSQDHLLLHTGKRSKLWPSPTAGSETKRATSTSHRLESSAHYPQEYSRVFNSFNWNAFYWYTSTTSTKTGLG